MVASAFATAPHAAPVDDSGEPGEAALVEWLRADSGWLPHLSLVAESDGVILGHALCTRGDVDGIPALGLGPVSVLPEAQRAGVGSALMREMIVRATAAGESLMVLLGDPDFYARFGFRPSEDLGVASPEPSWATFFQARALAPDHPRGRFRYAAPFERL